MKATNEKEYLTEVGPRLNFSTAWSTNAICIFHACGLTNIPRAECSRRYLVHSTEPLTKEEKTAYGVGLRQMDYVPFRIEPGYGGICSQEAVVTVKKVGA